MAFGDLLDSAVSDLSFGSASKTVTFAGTPSDGELIILRYHQNVDPPGTVTWPSGFTEIVASAILDSGSSIAVAWKLAASESGAAYTPNFDTDDSNQILTGYVFEGPFHATPINAVGTPAGDGFFFNETLNVPGITTTVDGCMICVATGGSGGVTDFALSGYIETTLSSGGRDALYHGVFKTPAGATGDLGIVKGSSGGPNIAAVAFAIAPAGGGGGTTVPVLYHHYRQMKGAA